MEELIFPFPAVQVLAGIVPRHFGRSEVFERLIALLRHQDKELGRTCSVRKEQMCTVYITLYVYYMYM